MLAYAKGGAAFTNFNYHTEEVGGIENFNADEDRTVPFVGCGLEYALTCHWSVRVEYNHLFSDSESVTGTESSGSQKESRAYGADPVVNSVQAGLNFKF
jgi:opacity protein-like surface antigen